MPPCKTRKNIFALYIFLLLKWCRWKRATSVSHKIRNDKIVPVMYSIFCRQAHRMKNALRIVLDVFEVVDVRKVYANSAKQRMVEGFFFLFLRVVGKFSVHGVESKGCIQCSLSDTSEKLFRSTFIHSFIQRRFPLFSLITQHKWQLSVFHLYFFLFSIHFGSVLINEKRCLANFHSGTRLRCRQ